MIRSLNILYRDENDLSDLPTDILAHPRDKMLIQVFSGILDDEQIDVLIDRLGTLFPGASILGTTTSGEILGGQSFDQSIVINISCFTHSTVRAALITQNEDLAEAGRQLATRLFQPETKAVIVFGCGIKDKRMIFAEPMLQSLHVAFPKVRIAGGQAGDNGKGTRTLVFTATGVTDSGFVAVSLAGTDLIASNAYTLSWIPIGKKLTITHAEGSRVYSIDGQTPYDIYSHYLGQEVANGLPLSAVDFPLMIEREGVLMAIHATGVNPDGSFNYIHHFHVGEQLRFGYCHAGLLALGAEKLHAELSQEGAQAAFIYSCVSRKWILGADVLVELTPIETLAPSAGFFCYGEYFGEPSSKPLFLSQTMTVLCLSEASIHAPNVSDTEKHPVATNCESRQFRTMRVLHRLVETSTREIESMNQELASLARKDSLTGLHNRRMFDEQLIREIRRQGRASTPLSLILMDVDHFKHFNDTYGHVMGDDCLRGVSQVLRNIVQRTSDLAARYGGEEFAIILPNTDHNVAMYLSEEIRQGIEHLDIPHCSSPTSQHVTASMGVITTSFDKTVTPESIVSQCDQQLYLAKTNGRNRVVGLDMTRSRVQ